MGHIMYSSAPLCVRVFFAVLLRLAAHSVRGSALLGARALLAVRGWVAAKIDKQVLQHFLQ